MKGIRVAMATGEGAANVVELPVTELDCVDEAQSLPDVVVMLNASRLRRR